MAPVVIRLDATHSPVEALSLFADRPSPCLLQSAAAGHPLSQYSFLSADPVAAISASAAEWPQVSARIRATQSTDNIRDAALPPFQGGWLGWFGYELGTAFDDIARHPVQSTPFADISLGLHDWVIAWDHARGETWLISTGVDASGNRDSDRAAERADSVLKQWQLPARTRTRGIHVVGPEPTSDFGEEEYRATVARVVEYVLAGDIFQANIAQRFTAPFRSDPVALYKGLTQLSPAPMAAFISHGPVTVVSSSPEQFMRLDAATRQVETRPIKGTRPRSAENVRDEALARELSTSEKDRAENVMIVDLLRNDLSRVCSPGTVHVPALCVLESHPTVHHLVSTVTGVLSDGRDALDLIAATFPGGSITGAPKLRAMEIIRELEPVARGAYSGAIGWIGLDGSMDTNIAIRTVTIADGIASYHVGGGITAMSVPDDEYRETLDKAGALRTAVLASG